MRFLVFLLIPILALAYTPGNDRISEADQIKVVNSTDITLQNNLDANTNNIFGIGNLTATGTTTLNTGLTGVLKGASGVVSAGNVNLTSEVTGVLPIANGGTGSATQNFVDLTTAQTVGGIKTFSVDSLWSGTGQIDLPVGTTAQRSGTPDSGMLRFNSDTVQFEGYNGTAWGEIGGGGSGGINYITNNDIEIDTTGYATYADAAGTEPVDGTGGTSSLTISRNTTTPLMDTADFKLAKGAVNEQGEGFSYDFTIDNGQQAKKLIISFEYDASHANYADDDIGIFIYDVTNATIIRVNGESLKGGKGTHYAQFQTAPDSTSYRLIFHVTSTSASAYDVYIDNVTVGPQVITHGAVDVYLGDIATTGSWTTNTTYTGKYWRKGNELIYDITVSLTGAPDNVSLEVTLPYTIDTSELSTTTQYSRYTGRGTIYDSSPLAARNALSVYFSSTQINVGHDSSGTFNQLNATTPITFATGDEINIVGRVPIQGWASNAKMSQDFSGREIVFRGRGNSGATITAGSERIDWTSVEDTTASWSQTDTNGGDTFTAPETGYYAINGNTLSTVSLSNVIYLYKNNTLWQAVNDQPTSTRHHFATTLYLVKGDFIDFRLSSNDITLSNNTSNHHITIRKTASPQTMFENELVAVMAKDDSGQSATSTPLTWNTELVDTHDAFTSGVFTCPITGIYRVTASVLSQGAAWTATTGFTLHIQVSGTTVRSKIKRAQVSATFLLDADISSDISCNKGQTIEVDSNSAATVNLYTANNNYNYISIHRIK